MEEKIKILYAEDNATAAAVYTEILEEAGFSVKVAPEGNEAWRLYETGKWDLLLLDMDLPGKDGHELIRLVRETGDQVPIVILSSANHNHALYEGADDYLVKGCSVDEVRARMDKAIARTRRLNKEQEQGLFHLSPTTTFNKNNRLLVISGKKEELKGMEAKILWLFCLRINEVISTVEMCETLWNIYSTDKEKSLTRYVCLLNKKLKADKTIAIQNEFATGYKLVNEL
ncbi:MULTISPECIES: response regulator transcription factor [Butyricimonas]|uniref:Response regulator transcription factor n=1 Tax=Butyricimonas hominis TaxID=2763032 RepID=A0ABR7CXL8_9BACT|nr:MULTISPECIES: response regulator transcription factor [Butyricimonas]MBC5620431.1 response regulator transcription factor [Butyricimonas hominis]